MELENRVLIIKLIFGLSFLSRSSLDYPLEQKPPTQKKDQEIFLKKGITLKKEVHSQKGIILSKNRLSRQKKGGGNLRKKKKILKKKAKNQQLK